MRDWIKDWEIEVNYLRGENSCRQFGSLDWWIEEHHWWGLIEEFSEEEYKAFLLLVQHKNFTSIQFGDEGLGWEIIKHNDESDEEDEGEIED